MALYILTLLLISISSCISVSEIELPFSNSPYLQNPAVYYEHLGTSRLIIDKWKILTYLELVDVMDIESKIYKYIFEMEHECGPLRNSTDCLQLEFSVKNIKISKLNMQIQTFLNDLVKMIPYTSPEVNKTIYDTQKIVSTIERNGYRKTRWNTFSAHIFPPSFNDILQDFEKLNQTIIQQNSLEKQLFTILEFMDILICV